MKKVALASCYFKHNYGSMLQAYATQMALDKLGYENETINISGFDNEIKRRKIKYFIKASLTSDILFFKFGMAKNALKKKLIRNEYTALSRLREEKFDVFCQRYFKLSQNYSSKADLSRKCAENYSAVLVGSDQLWLPGNIAADYYTLNFVPQSVNTIAYSTSFGQSSLPKDSQSKARQFLSRIRHISVREDSGQKIVLELTGRKIPVVCDPTMLFTGDEWLSIQRNEPFFDGKYIFCYFLGNNPLHRKFAKRLRNVTGYKIVALINLDEYVKCDNDYADATPYDVDPADFLNLIRNAAYVCTDSFHCTVFSMLYKRDFFTFKRYLRATRQSTNSRLDTLLGFTGLENRMLDGSEPAEQCLSMKIDYDKVQDKLEKKRFFSYNYLKSALQDEGSTDL